MTKTQKKKEFPHQEFEPRWQQHWEENKTFSPDMDTAEKPYYNLMMFPYPSAEGMHVGNMYAHTGADIHGRFRRMQGFDVFEPIGLDGFGIHSENFAMKVGRHPKEQAQRAEKNFYRQMHATGSGFDWQRTVETYDPEYYKWTQWLFTELFKAGLAERKKAVVNYCPSCKTVLSDEQVIAGECERCGSTVEKRELEQWFFKITNYSAKLLDNIEKLDWTEKVKIAQRNWIGRSKGALITFSIADFRLPNGGKPNFVLLHGFKGSPDRNFMPWLSKRLTDLGYEVQIPSLPNTDNPTEAEQVQAVLDSVTIDANTVILGHSLGAVIALKVAEKVSLNIAGLVLVGGFASPDFQDGKNRPYIDHFSWEFDWKAIQERCETITVLQDATDPIIPRRQAQLLADKLNARLVIAQASAEHFRGEQEHAVLETLIPSISVFTTRPDTIFGATFMAISPEHPVVRGIKSLEYDISQEIVSEVEEYVQKAAQKTDAERVAEDKEKTGVFSGLYAVNPASGEKMSIWIADYVLASYGTGAIMAVPAHDARDYDFATKYGLPIKHVVMPSYIDTLNPPQDGKENTKRNVIIGIVRNPKNNTYLILKWKEQDWKTFVTGGVEDGEDIVEAAQREITEETGYTDLKFVRQLGGPTEAFFYAAHKGVNRQTKAHAVLFELETENRREVERAEQDQHEVVWMSEEEVVKAGLRHGEFPILWERLKTGKDVYVGYGLLLNSGELDGYHSENDSDKILQFISEKGIGESKEQYHLRDWLISRQRYWGPPIPMIYCATCAGKGDSWFTGTEASVKNDALIDTMRGWYPVPASDLPVVLPDIQDFKPLGTGKSPLASHPEFYEAKCPGCGGAATRETDVSDTFLDSAWYFFRYTSTEKGDAAFDPARTKKWLPVNIYIGGAEHSVLHLLYARFITMVLHDLGYCDFEEPFSKFFAHGLLIKEGAKMSKSKGNVIIPDEYIAKYGSDTLRSYLMFLGPFSQGGDFYDTGIEGMYRFLRRIWKLYTERLVIAEPEDSAITRMRHKTVAAVTQDFEEFGYNTVLAKLMEFYNFLTDGKSELDAIEVSNDTAEALLQMLAPFAPHMTEELWHTVIKQNTSIHTSSWPHYDESQLVEDEVVIVVQVNGKRRAEVTFSQNEAHTQAVVEAQARTAVEKYLTSEPKKVIFVPGKIINFVI